MQRGTMALKRAHLSQGGFVYKALNQSELTLIGWHVLCRMDEMVLCYETSP